MISRYYVGWMALLVMTLTVTLSSAEPAPTDRSWLRQQEKPSGQSAPAPRSSLGQWLAGATLIGLTAFALWKRKQQHRANPVLAASRIKLSAVTKLSPKAQLVVATIHGRSMVLGVTDASVTRLMWLDSGPGEDSDRDSMSDPFPESDFEPQDGPETARFGADESKGRDAPARLPRGEKRAARSQPSSRFGEVLADALGFGPRKKETATRAAVDEVASGTVDHYIGSGRQAQARTQAQRRAGTPGPLINVEGQAAGLVARLNRHQS